MCLGSLFSRNLPASLSFMSCVHSCRLGLGGRKGKWGELQMIQLNWYCEQQNWEQMQFGSCWCDLIISYLPTPPPFLEFKNNYDIIANLEIPRCVVNTLCLIECSFPLFGNGTLLKMHTHKGGGRGSHKVIKWPSGNKSLWCYVPRKDIPTY